MRFTCTQNNEVKFKSEGVRDAQESRGLGDVYKRQVVQGAQFESAIAMAMRVVILREGLAMEAFK